MEPCFKRCKTLPVNIHNNPSEVGPDDKNADGDEEVVGGAHHILEHDQEEGGLVEGGQEFDEEHGKGIGEEEEEGEEDEHRDAGLVAGFPDGRADGIDTSHCPAMFSNQYWTIVKASDEMGIGLENYKIIANIITITIISGLQG